MKVMVVLAILIGSLGVAHVPISRVLTLLRVPKRAHANISSKNVELGGEI